MATRPSSEDASARADAALLRAGRSALAAEIQEQRAREAPAWLREVHEGLVVFHRQAQARHEAAASLQLAHAFRLASWAANQQRLAAPHPTLLAGVGDVVGAESAVVLLGTDDTPALIAASGRLAHRAVQLEYVIDEGPMHDCTVHRRPVSVGDPVEVWPSYGPPAATLGVRSVAANPLTAGGRHLGVLTIFNQPDTAHDPAPLGSVADAVTDSILDLAPGPALGSVGWDVLEATGQDVAALVNCASGMVAAHRGCPPEAALSLITSRAVDTGEQIEDVARRILDPGGLDDF